jgi:hypothetical protein
MLDSRLTRPTVSDSKTMEIWYRLLSVIRSKVLSCYISVEYAAIQVEAFSVVTRLTLQNSHCSNIESLCCTSDTAICKHMRFETAARESIWTSSGHGRSSQSRRRSSEVAIQGNMNTLLRRAVSDSLTSRIRESSMVKEPDKSGPTSMQADLNQIQPHVMQLQGNGSHLQVQ